uniref:Threonylcarbamoyl-AMP synthase n=1 Tax=Quercus lobata TaxID=97700 RepID=A0A7N2KZH7_QUELO
MSNWQAKLYGHDSLSLSIHFPRPPRVRTLMAFPQPQRLVVLAMAVKRSPKRLKYSTPRFTKEGGLLYVEADSSGADSWKLEPLVDLLKQGAVGVIPTDTLYAIVCDLKSPLAIERLRRIKNIEASKA